MASAQMQRCPKKGFYFGSLTGSKPQVSEDYSISETYYSDHKTFQSESYSYSVSETKKSSGKAPILALGSSNGFHMGNHGKPQCPPLGHGKNSTQTITQTQTQTYSPGKATGHKLTQKETHVYKTNQCSGICAQVEGIVAGAMANMEKKFASVRMGTRYGCSGNKVQNPTCNNGYRFTHGKTNKDSDGSSSDSNDEN